MNPSPVPTEWRAGRTPDGEAFRIQFDTPVGAAVYFFDAPALEAFIDGLQKVMATPAGRIVPASPEVVAHINRAERRRRERGER